MFPVPVPSLGTLGSLTPMHSEQSSVAGMGLFLGMEWGGFTSYPVGASHEADLSRVKSSPGTAGACHDLSAGVVGAHGAPHNSSSDGLIGRMGLHQGNE